jgi:hypothetical protein
VTEFFLKIIRRRRYIQANLLRESPIEQSETGTRKGFSELSGRIFGKEEGMSKSRELLEISQKCLELADETNDSARKNFLRRMAGEWKNLAQTQAWLDGEGDLTQAAELSCKKRGMSKDIFPQEFRSRPTALSRADDRPSDGE